MASREPTRTDNVAAASRSADAVRTQPNEFSEKFNRNRSQGGLITEFCANSTVHGVRYFTEKGRHWSERLWWIGAFIVALILCGFLIKNVYNNLDQSPVIVGFAEKSTPVWEIPFPAVTICSETKAKMEYLNFTKAFHIMAESAVPPYNMTDDEISRMEAVSQICDEHLTDGFELGENFTDAKIFDIIKEAAPTFEETMFFCKWRNDVSFCPYFKPILTEEGMCYTFNTLNSEEVYREGMNENLTYVRNNSRAEHWNLEDGYTESIPFDAETYPYRVYSADRQHALLLFLRLYEQDFDYVCRGGEQGFKMILHSPDELPDVSRGIRIPDQQILTIAVKPSIIKASPGSRYYEPNQRQCFFDSERELKFFRKYTQRNCELECLSNFTKVECGCVKFSMPRDADTKICGSGKMVCYNGAKDRLEFQKFADSIETVKKGCNCLPSCTSITYDAEISQVKYEWIRQFTAFKSDLNEFPGMHLTRTAIFFKNADVISLKRSELYGPTEFLAHCGGLLGLFMGVSLLSIVEAIYYATLRLGCTLRTRWTAADRNRVSE